MEDLVKNIKRFCIANNLTVSQMEEALSFSKGLTSRWARMSPSLDKIVKVADYLNVSIDDLVGRECQNESCSLINRLCQKTLNEELDWIPCGYNDPFYYPISKIRELRNYNWICGYCQYKDGFFLLACAMNEQEELEEAGLYILASADETPVRWNEELNDLKSLYDVVGERIAWKENEKNAKKFVEDFMKDFEQ